MDKICYKVVSKFNYSFCSTIKYNSEFCSTSWQLNLNFLLYELGKKTVPKIGKIFVFDNLRNASDFYNTSHFILKGIATNISRPKYCSKYIYDYVDFWWDSRKKKKSLISNSIFVPYGTIWCDSFTPTAIINPLTEEDEYHG